MKRKMAIILSVIGIVLIGVAVWRSMPMDLMNLDYRDVEEIVIFDGNRGKQSSITDREEIRHIIENLNHVKVKRDKLSNGYSGFRFDMDIRLADGKDAGDWGHFIINSEDSIRKDPFFYTVTKGKIDYSYIEGIMESDKF